MSKARDLANAGTALTTVSATELAFLDGVTSAVQTQIDSKIAQATAINPAIVDAKGDIVAATAADTVARLAVGANATVLTADSAEATGLKWAAPGGSANSSFSLLNAGGTALTGATTITVSGISGYEKFLVVVIGGSTGASADFILRINGDTGTNYVNAGSKINAASSYSTAIVEVTGSISATGFTAAAMSSTGGSTVNFSSYITGGLTTGGKSAITLGAGNASGSNSHAALHTGGIYLGTATISSISVFSNNNNFDAGTLYVYGSA